MGLTIVAAASISNQSCGKDETGRIAFRITCELWYDHTLQN
jgi:hypothetical protein